MSRLVITQKIAPEALARLEAAGISFVYEGNDAPWPRKKLLAAAAQATALICLLTDRIDA